MSLLRFSIALAAALFLVGGVHGAEDGVKPPDRPAPAIVPVRPKGPVMVVALTMLQKEFQAHVKDPKSNRLRDKSDYFKQNPSPDVTPEVILKGLEGSVSGGAQAEAYVKWQLLSGMPDKFPEDLVKRGIAVYRRAPSLPRSHPGTDHRAMNRVIMGAQKDRIPAIQKDLDATVSEVGSANRLVLIYRDDLLSKLPGTYEVLSAGLADAGDRALCGLNANGLFTNLSNQIRSWAISQAKSGQVKSIADEVAAVKAIVTKDVNKPYSKLVDESGLKWKAEAQTIDVKKLDELLKFLDANITATGSGGLKFKDEK